MKKWKYLPLYYQWMKKGKLPIAGLCPSLSWDEELDLFKPTDVDIGLYWLSDPFSDTEAKKFNPLRQNVVLFLAAMSGEL